MNLKTHSEKRGEHVHVAFFMGPDSDHLAKCGALVLRVGEAHLLGACLLLGQQKMTGHLSVEMTGYLADPVTPIHGIIAEIVEQEDDL